VTGRELSHEHSEFSEVHLVISVDQFVNGTLIPSTLGRERPTVSYVGAVRGLSHSQLCGWEREAPVFVSHLLSQGSGLARPSCAAGYPVSLQRTHRLLKVVYATQYNTN
jgi:hypothetical protein